MNLLQAEIVPYNPYGSGSTSPQVYAKSGYEYNSSLLNNTYSSYVKTKGEAVERDKDLVGTYSHDDVLDNCDVISNTTIEYNPTFDGSTTINNLNFPISVPISISMPVTVFPFPEITIPITIAPEITFPIEQEITAENIAPFENVPIINNLEKRFPFSIPWDIKNLLSVLKTRAKAPNIHINFTFPVINYTWSFDLDLSPFDQTAQLFRLCFLISFVIGLAVFSYNHFFGT